MGNGFEHAALAVFTTLAPMGAGAFIALAYAFIFDAPDETSAKRLDRWTALPLAVLVGGFVGAFLHLASPLHAFGVFAGVGASPLSNEVLVGVVFAVFAVAYWVLALAGKLSALARKTLLVVLAVLAFVFAAFCGLAYMMYTIPTWNTPLSVVQMVGYMLAGGTVLGFCTVAFAQVRLAKRAKAAALALTLVGVAIGTAGFGVQIAGLDSIRNIWSSAAELVPDAWALLGAFSLCGLVAAALTYCAARRRHATPFLIAACVVVAVGIFVARIGFYGLYMGIAL